MSRISYQKSFREKSFVDQDLSGFDFSYADIRGSDFTRAILVGADLSYTKAGLSSSWTLTLNTILLILVALATFISAFGGAFLGGYTGNIKSLAGGLFVAIFMTFFFLGFLLIILFKGIGAELWLFSGVFVTLVSITIAFPGYPIPNSRVFAIFMAMLLTVNLAGIFLGSIAVAVAKILSKRWKSYEIIAISSISLLLGAFEGGIYELVGKPTLFWALVIMMPTTISSIALMIYVGSCAVREDKRYQLIGNLAVNLASKGGTRFTSADLTDANFSCSNLKNSDFRNAVLTRTCWQDVQNLEECRLEGTYLEISIIRELVVTKKGQSKDFMGLDLQDLNLNNVNFTASNLMGVKLSGSSLRSANLEKANLARVQLYGTDLTGAILTGSTIENWAISVDSKLDNIECDYVYMRLPTADDPDPWRKPDDRSQIFQSNDFTDFISPIVKTLEIYRKQYVDPRRIEISFKSLDLYHYDKIDPAAVAIAVQQLAEENPEAELEIVALEGKGEQKIRLQATINDRIDTAQLNAQYFEKYRKILSLPYSDIQAVLKDSIQKDQRIQGLERLLETALQQPKFYIETYQNKGEFIMSQSKGNISITGVEGSVSGVVASGESQNMTGVAIGTISGSVTNSIGQLPESDDPEKPGIKELLSQLQSAIEFEKELSNEDKTEALEQLETLVEAWQKPEDSNLQKAAKTAIKIIKGTVAGLSDTAQLTESCTRLLPAIASLLALI
ncbi:MAG: low-complexity protein [Spirulina sp. SIO3F2]|nr:low-complexity protein [Spirulina sp. SIO3F2]